ncbi:MAG TPA: amidohydrolase family protein [Vicinamibacterales bacterium]|nr:amidohydrolase family protein [Vicinamibacterales bacterium]
MLKLDIFNHFFPERYFAKLEVIAPAHKDMGKRIRNIPLLRDLDARFRVMDGFGEYQQILSLASPPIEVLAGPRDAIELAQVANDGLADLVRRYPSRFPGFVASLPLNDPAATIAEAERALRDLNACGVQVFTNVNGAPLTSPELLPLFDLMAERNRPIWMHPARGSDFADYRTEKESKFEIWWTFGWPYETSVAMARMVFAGLFDRHPSLTIITHHMGGMIPYFEGRVGHGWDQLGTRTSDEDYGPVLRTLKRRPLDYFRMFYADTALFGAAAGTACGLDFFGVDRVLFASDTPFEPQPGLYIRETVDIIDRLPISDAERAQIYAGNAQRLLKLGA